MLKVYLVILGFMTTSPNVPGNAGEGASGLEALNIVPMSSMEACIKARDKGIREQALPDGGTGYAVPYCLEGDMILLDDKPTQQSTPTIEH
ncbi:hypothetical protein [Rhizobium phage RHph_I40]|uniref:Uncharacterized protein n=1 Tax=Rhizobium phage RHph_I38 TaxID=2509734 RepID=A0A7S5RIV5_9CAUD|nr:hypothetical protein EVC01_005 [Rhizobium phage RHph_I38]QXV73634.1 hypothetical protein [Rhizobium phage RHph_I40]